MKVLWLCSWYPHSIDPFDGDFIERQAKALALYQQVDVIHVVQNLDFLKKETAFRVEEKNEHQLSASVYFLPLAGISVLQKMFFNKQYHSVYKKLINEYIKKNGQPDLIHVHVPVKAGAVAVRLKKKFNIPFVVTEHSSAYYRHIPENYFHRNGYFRYVTKQSFEQADVVSSVSGWLLHRLDDIFNIRQTKLIRNVVDTSLFYPITVQNKRKRFLHVSMMHPLKNVKGILLALAELNKSTTEWEMNFIGPASIDNLKLAVELKLDHQIAFKGTLNYLDVAKQMQAADALVHFSNYENLPCVVNEALCCGLPVISSNVGGISELINETNGILVEEGNIAALSAALNLYLQNPDQFHKEQISKNATAQFNPATIGQQLLNLYNEISVK